MVQMWIGCDDGVKEEGCSSTLPQVPIQRSMHRPALISYQLPIATQQSRIFTNVPEFTSSDCSY